MQQEEDNLHASPEHRLDRACEELFRRQVFEFPVEDQRVARDVVERLKVDGHTYTDIAAWVGYSAQHLANWRNDRIKGPTVGNRVIQMVNRRSSTSYMSRTRSTAPGRTVQQR
jgi:hypothetical protein